MKEGTDLKEPIVEFTFKDDARHDPFVVITKKGPWELYDSAKPVGPDSLIGKIDPQLSPNEVTLVQKEANKTFRVLKEAWGKLDIKLIDLKIEFGRTPDSRVAVADVIDNDSWRLWPQGDKSRQLDKQIYREGGHLDEVFRNYKKVAEMTDQFRDQ
jgi:phosphoribosylaminoimidazole-succinocarboxamide synthase